MKAADILKPKNVLKTLIPLLLCTVLFSCVGQSAATLHRQTDPGYIPYGEQLKGLSVSCPQVFIYDLSAGEIIYMKGGDRVIRPASVTKLLTALYALTVLEPDTLVPPGEEVGLISADSSIAYIKTYHTLSVEMLIEGMLLPSGNDAAYALAGAAGRVLADDPELSATQAIAVFMDGMNGYAKEIGCVGSYFNVPDGNDEKIPYTTAENLILIGRLAAENEIIRKYAALAFDHVTYADGSINDWTNTNVMLDPDSPYYHPAVVGLKTGAVGGKYHFLCLAEEGDQRYLIGIFGGRNKDVRFEDALKICEKLFDE